MIFSDPGSEEDAIRNGTHDRWLRIKSSTRYQMHMMKRYLPPREVVHPIRLRRNPEPSFSPNEGAWAVALSGTAGNSTPADMYPAKFTFSPTATPSCGNQGSGNPGATTSSDFVVFPVNVASSSTQANLVGFTNLYTTTCAAGGTSTPSVLFAYEIDAGGGKLQTSPTISLDGRKVAFVESLAGGSKFHVLTLDKSGTSSVRGINNGTSYSSPAVPGTSNAAVDSAITMSGGVMVTRSSPYIDYDNDVAYVGDDTGMLHKFTGVFQGTPVEAGSPWPVNVIAFNTTQTPGALTGPVHDYVSNNIYVGSASTNSGVNIGILYCVTSAGAACSPYSNVVMGSSEVDSPIVDATTQQVFEFSDTNPSTYAQVAQVPTTLPSSTSGVISAHVGLSGGNRYDGAFDNLYYNSPSTGHIYMCGNSASTNHVPTLWSVGFNSAGVMSSTAGASAFQLVTAGTSTYCSPLSEAYNPNTGVDLLFLSVLQDGFNTGTTNCAAKACVMSFNITTGFPTVANSTNTTYLSGTTYGTSGIIIDNVVSTTTGAAQFYFGSPGLHEAVQLSQSGLQ